MTKPIGRDTIYRCRRFSAETIELCVRWHITYRLSYRDLAAMMAEPREYRRRRSGNFVWIYRLLSPPSEDFYRIF
jgi:hypothetical protein